MKRFNQHGGARPGAGRPRGSGKYGQPTIAVRLPKDAWTHWQKTGCLSGGISLPLYGARVQAGFPSPADDYVEGKLDLNTHLIDQPAATFLVRATGDSMVKVGIFPGDILVVDRSVAPRHGHIVIAAVDGELTVKRLYRKNGVVELCPENDRYPPIKVEGELHIWGVVKHVIHSLT